MKPPLQPVPKEEEGWWTKHSISTDTAQTVEARRQRFISEARALFLRGQRALGDEEAERVWRAICTAPAKKPTGAHNPVEDARLLAIYDRHCEIRKRGARAAAINEWAESHNNLVAGSIGTHLDRLRKARVTYLKEQATYRASLPKTILGE